MATVTPNFNWPVPTSTDLVKDGATAIEALGDSIDASLVDLKGGTTGQVLSKNSNTDMDFVWVTDAAGDITGVTAGTGISGGGTSGTVTVTNSMATAIDAKGDLVPGTGADTFARLAVGNNGESLVADSSTATGLRYQATNEAGKNCIINGGMDIWQRGTSVTATGYTADRWYVLSGASVTVTQSTAKTTPNSQYMMLMTATTTQQIFAYQAVETLNADYYAGKTVTLSAYAAGLTTTTNLIMILAYSTSVDNSVTGTWTDITVAGGNANLTLSSTVTRWSASYDVPSNAKSLRVLFVNNAANITVGQGIYLGDVQLEVGSVATAFSRSGGNIAGELAACQRYYERTNWDAATGYATFGQGAAQTTTNARTLVPFQVQKRVRPTAIDYPTVSTNFRVLDFADNVIGAPSAVAFDANQTSTSVGYLNWTTSGATVNRPYLVTGNNSTGAYLGWSAEL